jgi:protein involved in polysaccharide export with SLBB domain
MLYKKLALFIVSFLFVLSTIGQTSGSDVSKINIDELSDAQITQLLNRASLTGLSDEDMERKALEAGFTPSQVSKLKERISRMNDNGKKSDNKEANNSDDPYNRGKNKENRKTPEQLNEDKKRSKIFGSEFFSNQNLTFEPNLSIATPSNYVIGVGDKLVLDVFGYSEFQYKLTVSPDGNIRIPNIGPVYLNGLTIEEAKVKLKKQLATIYSSINTGQTSFQLALGEIRSIHVTLIGEVMKPASYTLPSLATIANALYLSGGPTVNGSFRNIELMRNGKKISTFDFYDFLLFGDLSKNVLLHDQDVIRVNAYTRRVELSGAVKREAIFEVKENESLKDILNFAGGFSDAANKEIITAYRFSGREKEIVTVPFAKVEGFQLQTGDSIVINSVINRFKNRIAVDGAVFYPGNYSLLQTPTLKDLLEFAQIKESAFRERGIIRRLQTDFRPSYINFNITDILSGKMNVPLIREDSIHIFDLQEVQEKYTVSINGEVNFPGTFDYGRNMTVQDIILTAGGFKDGASNKRIEISRRLRGDNDGDSISAAYALVNTIVVNKDLSAVDSSNRNFALEPFDVISIRKSPTYKEQVTAKVEGEVKYPGEYTIQSRSERLSDLIVRAGGLTVQAYVDGAVLNRKANETVKDTSQITNRLRILGKQTKNTDTSSVARDNQLNVERKPVGIRLGEALATPGSTYDIFLEQGDVLKVPKQLQTVETFGGVNVAQKIIYRKGMNIADAVRESGGYAVGAVKRRAYVIRPNGEVVGTSNFLFFHFYPKLSPGSEVYVPVKTTTKSLSTGEIIGIASSVAGLGAIVISLLNFLKN